MEEIRNVNILVGQRWYGRPMHKQDDHLNVDKVQWQYLVNTVINIQFP